MGSIPSPGTNLRKWSAGDPEWTDYQIEADVYNFNDPAFENRGGIGQVNYLKFGPYGRLNVPNLPETRGEHSFVGVKFGTFGNYDVSEMTFGNNAFQIRCKYPESPLVWRDHSVLLRQTRILDYQAWPIPQGKRIHLKAVYFGRRVEGWIDGKKITESEIPEDHPGARRGRFGLWAFETWCEFDNVKVTRLIPARSTPLTSPRDTAAKLPCRAEFFNVEGRPAFLMLPEKESGPSGIPWVWYAPTFPAHPDASHLWMFRQFLEKGIAIAGVDVGESCGSPEGRRIYSALHARLRQDYHLTERACLLPQSRGGLMLYNWAAENPKRVACIAGIFTVCDLRSYPGLAKACGAFRMDEARLAACLAEHNPVDRLQALAEEGVPILHVHGDADPVVPLEKNAGEVASRYRALGGPARLIVVPGKGHQVAPEFFECQELVDFVIAEALAAREGRAARERSVLLKDFMAPLDLSRQAQRSLAGFMIRNPERLTGPEGYYRTHFSCSLLPRAGLGHGRWDCGDLTSRAILAWLALRDMTGDTQTGRDGAWGTGPLPNDMIWKGSIPVSGCCQYAGVRGLYSGWRAAMSHNDGQLRIHYFLDCKSSAAVMSTELPASGKARIKLLADAEVLIRVPRWLQPSEMKITAIGQVVDSASRLDSTRRHVRVGKLPAGAEIEVEFPLRNRASEELIGTSTYGMVWRGNYVVRMVPSAGTLPLYPR